MKSVFILFLFFSTILTLCAETRHDYTMQLEGKTRQFILSEPDGQPPAGGYPVVFMFHGTSGDGEKFYNISGWKEKGEVEKFISVFPSSLSWCFIEDSKPKNNTKWVCGDLIDSACPNQNFTDDVYFVRKMVDTIKTLFTINSSKIYGSGFSNGGGFVSKLAIEASDIFAALAPHAGALNVLDSGDAIRNVPVWLSVGTKDDRWTSYTNYTELPLNDTSLAIFQRLINRYLVCLGLSDTYTKNSIPLALTYTFDEPEMTEEASVFRFSLIKGLFHQYPNGENVPYAIADVLWPFFSQYSLILDVDDNSGNVSGDFGIYPIPAGNYIEIRKSSEGLNYSDGSTIGIYNSLGQCVESIETHGSATQKIDISNLSSGVYSLRIGNKSKMFVKE